MTADKLTPVTPNLRFPEFRTAGNWHFKPLGNIAEPISDRVRTMKCVPMSVTTGVGLVSQEEKFGRTIAGNSYKNYIRLQTNDFAYNKSATKEFPQGYIARYSGTKDAAVPNSIFTCFRPDTAAVIPEYLDLLFHRNHHGRWLRKYITVGARAHGALSVSDHDLMSMPVSLPPDAVSRPEQQKIADCVGSLDELIAAEGRRLKALRQHKKELMQQLLPQEGETVPHLRFPEFRGASAWKPQRLDAVSPSIFDGTHQTPTYTEDGVPFYSVENLISGIPNKFTSRDAYLEATRKNKPEKGDILLTRIGKIGHSQAVTWDHEFSVYVTLAVIKASPRFDTNYLAYYLQSGCYQTELIRKSLQSAVPPKINLDSLRSTLVLLPGMEEQVKIANCLSPLDDQISAQAEKLTALKRHKQGLLQQLFPSLEGR